MNDLSQDALVDEGTEQGLGQDQVPADSTSDSSPEAGDNQSEKRNGVQERFNKLTAEKYEAKRRADELERQLAQERAAKALQPTTQPVETQFNEPKLPDDPYDQEAMQQYHRDMLAFNQRAAQAAAKHTFEEQQRAAIAAKQQAEMQQVVSNFANNAVRDGVDMDKLRAAEQSLNQAGISPQLGQYLMTDPRGGKIAEYLHDNPSVMYEVLSLDPVSAGIKIEQEIKPQALSTTPKVSNAPEPLPEIKGGGALDKDDFERRNPGTQFI